MSFERARPHPAMSADTALLHQLLLAAQQLVAPNRARANMTSAEYAALQHLAHHREGLTPGQLGARLAITSGTTTKLIDRLARRYRPPIGDRRTLTVIATPKGTRLIDNDLEEILASLPTDTRPPTERERSTIQRLLALTRREAAPPDRP